MTATVTVRSPINYAGWLLFFYSVPSKPVSNRMRIWRKLAKAGAMPLRGAVYILPHNEEHYELFQWLVSEVTAMNGEAAFAKLEEIETLKHTEIIDQFNRQREKDYGVIERGLEDLERGISSIRKGSGVQSAKKLSDQLNNYLKEFEEIRRIDFFSSKKGDELRRRIKTLETEINGISGSRMKEQKVALVPKSIENYQGKVWVTRKRPYVDRMASAWLIKKFIDKKALFRFIDEQDMEGTGKEAVTFDIRGGQFTHIGDMCTFEALLRAFGLRDRVLKKIGEIVHELDVKDEKFKTPEARGIEEVLTGIRKTAKDDAEALEKGLAVFEMLYASKTA